MQDLEPESWRLTEHGLRHEDSRCAGCGGGVIELTRATSDGAVNRAVCRACGRRWERRDARYRWREGEG